MHFIHFDCQQPQIVELVVVFVYASICLHQTDIVEIPDQNWYIFVLFNSESRIRTGPHNLSLTVAVHEL